MRRCIACLLMLTLLIVTFASGAKATHCASYPLLSVIKRTDKGQVRLGEEFTVIVEIINTSNETAYNVTLIEPDYPSWAFEVIGNTTASWPELRPGERVWHSYRLIIKTAFSTKVNLWRATVVYYDANGTKYESLSEECVINVIIGSPEKPNPAKIVAPAILPAVCLFLAVALALAMGEFLTYLRYTRERKRR